MGVGFGKWCLMVFSGFKRSPTPRALSSSAFTKLLSILKLSDHDVPAWVDRNVCKPCTDDCSQTFLRLFAKPREPHPQGRLRQRRGCLIPSSFLVVWDTEIPVEVSYSPNLF